MNGGELLKKLRRAAKRRGAELHVLEQLGKGSHAVVLFGDKRTTLTDRRKEISPALPAAMLKQLGLKKTDLD